MKRVSASGPKSLIRQIAKMATPWLLILLVGTVGAAVMAVPAAATYAVAHATELLAVACGVIGTLMLALNGPRAGWGFVWYLGSNAFWIAFAIGTQQWPLMVQNLAFTVSSLLGVWLWLFVKRPSPLLITDQSVLAWIPRSAVMLPAIKDARPTEVYLTMDELKDFAEAAIKAHARR